MQSEPASTFLDEVAEQPQALRALVAYYAGEGRGLLERWAQLATQAKRAVFCGMGTSAFAADFVLQSLAQNGVDASILDAGEWLHYPQPFCGLWVCISQSGESVETRQVAERLAGTAFVAITNDLRSTLARHAALVLPLHAGHESAISTKTYVNTLALLYLMAEACSGAGARAANSRAARGTSALERLAAVAEKLPMKDLPGVSQAAALLAESPAIHFVARGPTLVAAKQAALTFMEGTRMSGVALSGGAFRHGPMELAGEGHACVSFIPRGQTSALLQAAAAEILEKGSRVVAITNQTLSLASPRLQVLAVPDVDEDLFALAAAPAQELLLYEVARKRGLTAGVFRYGAKITLRE